MSDIRRILVVVHPSLEETPALRKAVALARSWRAELWLALFERGPRLGVLGILDRAEAHRLEAMMREQIGTRFAELAARVREDSGLTVHTIDEPVSLDAGRVAARVARHDIDLVLKDVAHVSALRRILFVPADWDLLRTCPVPLWLVTGQGSTLPSRVEVAVDPLHPEHGSALNPRIVDLARTVAQPGKARVHVLSAFEGFPVSLASMEPEASGIAFPTEALYEELRREHRVSFAGMLAANRLQPDQGDVVYGAAANALSDAVRERDADLLVMGVMRRHGFERFLMGSTAERLVDYSPCDVLAVPAPVADEPALGLAGAGNRAAA